MRSIAALSFAVAGLAVGWVLHQPGAPVAAPPACEAPAPPPAVDRAELAMLMRGIVRDELQRAAPRPAGAPGVVEREAPRAAPSEPSAEQLSARDDATSLAGAARSAGRWTEEDRVHLRQLIPRLDPKAREELLSTLLAAVNRQEIKPEVHGAPF